MQISFEILLLSKRASRYVNNSIELQDMKANLNFSFYTTATAKNIAVGLWYGVIVVVLR